MALSITTIADYGTHRVLAVDFFGDKLVVTVTDTPSVIRRWIRSVIFNHIRRRFRSHPLVVGVGVNWTPSRSVSDPEADTLQLCVGKRCIIIQLTHCPRVPLALRRFLVNWRATFVGIWNSQDARKLERSRHQLEIPDGELLDVRKYVRDSRGESLRGCSFEEIVEECLGRHGVRLDKEISMSDWSVDRLGHDQILQASVDAFVCCKLGVQERLWELV